MTEFDSVNFATKLSILSEVAFNATKSKNYSIETLRRAQGIGFVTKFSASLDTSSGLENFDKALYAFSSKYPPRKSRQWFISFRHNHLFFVRPWLWHGRRPFFFIRLPSFSGLLFPFFLFFLFFHHFRNNKFHRPERIRL